MFDDFEEKFNPLDVKPKVEPPDTIDESSHQPLKLSAERNFGLKTEIKIETFDDYLKQEDSISCGNDFDPLKTNQCKKKLSYR